MKRSEISLSSPKEQTLLVSIESKRIAAVGKDELGDLLTAGCVGAACTEGTAPKGSRAATSAGTSLSSSRTSSSSRVPARGRRWQPTSASRHRVIAAPVRHDLNTAGAADSELSAE